MPSVHPMHLHLHSGMLYPFFYQVNKDHWSSRWRRELTSARNRALQRVFPCPLEKFYILGLELMVLV